MARLLAAETRAAEALVRLAARVGDGDLTARAEHGAGAVGDAVEAVNQGTERLAAGGARRAQPRARRWPTWRRPLPPRRTT